MSAALATADRAKDPAPRDLERGRLLGLVRKLIDYGREMVASLQAHDSPTPSPVMAWRFGSLSLTLIIARITRGLILAGLMEKRLLRPLPSPAKPAVRVESSRKPRAPRQPPVDEAAELLACLPSAKEIAARLRNRKTGAVLVEICRDLGIGTDHPLWPEIRDAIMFNGGRFANMMRVWMRRAAESSLLPPAMMPWGQHVEADARPP